MKQLMSIRKKNKKYIISSCLSWASSILYQANIESAEQEAQILLAHVLRLSRARVLAEKRSLIGTKYWNQYKTLILKRQKRKPLQYLLGYEEFKDFILNVGPGVLIPRPETEIILDETLTYWQKPNFPKRIVDLGTGSGNLALALARIFPLAEVFAIDCSPKALYWARRNRRLLKVKNVKFFQGDAELSIPRRLWNTFSLVVSNPPYIPAGELAALQPEIHYEPRQALNGGQDGLRSIDRMLKAANKLLHQQGIFVCEIGFGQYPAVKKMFHRQGFSSIQMQVDGQKIPRVISGQYTGSTLSS